MFKIITVNVKSIFVVLLTMCLFCGQSQAAYERNQAVPVEKVIYGQIESVKNITEKQLVEDSHSGWKTFGGALVGGVIGHQFGGGSGQDVATVLGALIGGVIGGFMTIMFFAGRELISDLNKQAQEIQQPI